MSLTSQADFGGGIFRSPRAPRGSVYDAIDGLIDDELAIYRRGGAVYKTNADLPGFPNNEARGIAAETLAGGPRTVFWSSGGLVFRLQLGDDTTPVAVAIGSAAVSGVIVAGLPPQDYRRAKGVAGMMAILTNTPGRVWLYGGSGKSADYGTGTVTTTVGSTQVVGVGTAWVANVDPGMMFKAGTHYGVVRSVESNTTLTLYSPFLEATAGVGYTMSPAWTQSSPVLSSSAVSHIASVGSPARLLISLDNRVWFSDPGDPFTFDETNFHELPAGIIIGADSVRDTAVLFATTGVWLISNMNLDLTDATGEPQQQLSQISKDIILWDDAGVAGLSTYAGLLGWSGQLIVPALDDVYMLGVDSPPVPLSRGIRPLYRSYVASGLRCGVATLFRGHYFLPVIDTASTPDVVVDTLVCRLDQRDSRGQIRPGWTRLGSGARGSAFAGRVLPSQSPDLFGTWHARVLDLSDTFAPSAATKNDADGSTHNLDVTLNDLEVPRSTLQRVRVHAEIVDAASDNPTLAASYGVDAAEGAALTALPDVMAETTTTPKSWRIVKRGRRFRLRLLSSGPAAKVRIRVVEWFVRDSNRP